jgi:hypothetical protein
VACDADRWILDELPCPHVELPAVPRAGDDVSADGAFAERPAAIETQVVIA